MKAIGFKLQEKLKTTSPRQAKLMDLPQLVKTVINREEGQSAVDYVITILRKEGRPVHFTGGPFP